MSERIEGVVAWVAKPRTGDTDAKNKSVREREIVWTRDARTRTELARYIVEDDGGGVDQMSSESETKTPAYRHEWSQDQVQVELVMMNIIPLGYLSYIPFHRT